jgi:hypothetical protein
LPLLNSERSPILAITCTVSELTSDRSRMQGNRPAYREGERVSGLSLVHNRVTVSNNLYLGSLRIASIKMYVGFSPVFRMGRFIRNWVEINTNCSHTLPWQITDTHCCSSCCGRSQPYCCSSCCGRLQTYTAVADHRHTAVVVAVADRRHTLP